MNELISQIALSFKGVTQAPHMDKVGYKVMKKIFMTHNAKENRITVKLNEFDQDVFTKISKGRIHPVPNKWGKQGWTNVHLEGFTEEQLTDIIATAYVTGGGKLEE